MMTNGLQFQDVTKVFDDRAAGIRDVSLAVPWGTTYVLLGANGAGKTTLLNLCLGHLVPDSGSISIAGLRVSGQGPAARRRLAYVPEVSRLYPHLSAVENIRFFLKLSNKHPADGDIETALDRLRFPGAARTTAARTFSKGMRQKVVIAIGLLKNADVFLFDEPMSGLDPISTRTFLEIIEELRSGGKAILASSHDLHHLPRTADRLGVLRAGRLIRECAGTEVIDALDLFSDDGH